MWMVAAIGGLTAQVGWLGLRVGGHPALSLHSSNEPGELSQWPWSRWQHHKHCRWLLLLWIPLRNVQANWCRWCSRYRTSQRMSGLTGGVTSTCRTIVDVSTTPLTSAAEETVRSFSTCVVHWRRRTSSSSTFQLYNCWQMHLRNCLWWQTFFYLLVVFHC